MKEVDLRNSMPINHTTYEVDEDVLNEQAHNVDRSSLSVGLEDLFDARAFVSNHRCHQRKDGCDERYEYYSAYGELCLNADILIVGYLWFAVKSFDDFKDNEWGNSVKSKLQK